MFTKYLSKRKENYIIYKMSHSFMLQQRFKMEMKVIA